MKDLLEKATDYCNGLGVDYFEIRLSRLLRNIVQVRNDSVSILQPSASSHASVRVFDGAWGFAYLNELTPEKFRQAANQATKLARNSADMLKEKIQIYHAPTVSYSNLDKSLHDPREGSIDELQEIFLESTKAGQEVDERINLMIFHCENDVELNYYTNSIDSWIESFVPRTFLIVYALAKDGATVKRKRNRLVVSASSEVLAYSDPISLGKNVAEEAVSTLAAKPHPKGKMPILIDNFLGGTFGSLLSAELKASNILAGTSEDNFYLKNINKQIASEQLTISNEPNLEGMPVYYEYDMEGIKAQTKELIKDGVLCGCLHDKTTAAIMGETPKGSTRAVDAAHPPIAEFGNILIKTGSYSLPEMIEDIEQGIYARGLAGATTMGTKSMITSESGFLIENGELTDPLDQVSLTIDSTTDLEQIDAVGNDFSPASLRSYSGAYYALVGTGSPHIRFKALEVK